MQQTFEQDDETAGALPEVRSTLYEMCRPFGPIAHWEVKSANEGLFHCEVRLLDPHKQSLMVRTLGLSERSGGVSVAIRVRKRNSA